MTTTDAMLSVGTSGWSYDHWSHLFYPEGLSVHRRLEHYASRFDTVEVNATFYRLPAEDTVASWRDAVPEGFLFAVKGSRLITHFRRLTAVEEPLAVFLRRVGLLGRKLAVVLWQLPPVFRRGDAAFDALAHFLSLLARSGIRHAFEFRHESWFAEDTYALLREHDAALVSASGDRVRACLVPTASFAYARFHGMAEHGGAYGPAALEPWAAFLRDQLAAGRDCYAYFNNDAEGHAPADAARLRGMLANGPGRGRPTRGWAR